MTARLAGSWALLGTGMRGLRSRLLLTVGSILLAAIAVSAAVVGPMYQTGAASSYLVTKLQSQPESMTGVVFDYTPVQAPQQGYPAALSSASGLAARALNDRFGPATLALSTTRLPGLGGEVSLLSETGACAHLAIVGRCPTKAGEAMILKADSTFAKVKIGQQVKVEGVDRPLTIVGIYSAHPFDEHFWFDPTNLQSVPPQPVGSGGGLTTYFPAPLVVSQQTFGHLRPSSWFVKATRRLVVTPQTSAADLEQATRGVVAVEAADRARGGAAPRPGSLTPELGNQLVSISHQLRQREGTARSTVAPAVISVILVALVLLLRLLSAAMDLRRSELALASLRGYTRRQMWLLGLVEPLLMLLIATPIGILAGYLGARALARTWLVPGLPMPLGLASLLAMALVVLTTLLVAALVVRESLSEPLSAQIAGVRRPGRSGRWSLLTQLVLIALAVAVLVATLAHGKKSSPDATDLALPILLAVAAGLLTTIAAQALARWWSTWTAGRRGVFTYLASRTISRRREGTLVILPLTAALAVAVFAAGVFTAAADWRASDAATTVGADQSFSTKLTMDQTVALTHQIDPAGKWLMAVGAEYTPDGEKLIMDTPRLPRVGVWPSSWTPGMSAAEVSTALSTRRPAVILTGSKVSLTIDNQVSGDYSTLGVDLTMSTSTGTQVDVLLGRFGRGVSTRTAVLHDCSTGCLLKQLSFGGPATLPEAMTGTATITGFNVDGRPVGPALNLPWRTSQPLLDTPSAVAGQPQVGGGALKVSFDSRTAQSFAGITPDDVPLVRPVIVGRTALLTVDKVLGHGDLQLHTDASIPLDIHSVARAESMPVQGPTGMLIDYTMFTRDVSITNPATFVTVLARSDTPASVVDALAAHGINQPQTLAATRGLLDQDAFALALNLYVVVTVIVILLALAGLGANLAVQMPARRRDAASLRVVGVRRRSIMSAVVAEFLVVLGAAALAGVAAGSLAQYVVVRTVTLGYADSEHTPRLLPSLNVGNVVGLLVIVTAFLFAVAVAVATLTVRGARTASLRENAR